jgi:hypothetical protein
MSPLWPLAHIQGRPLRPDCIEEEDATDDDAILKHVVIVLAPTNWRALKDQRGNGSGYVGRKLS